VPIKKAKPKKKFKRVRDDQDFIETRKVRKKACKFCLEKTVRVNYKDINMIRIFVSDRGKIVPKRISGNCSKHQRQVTRAIKRCRSLALLPYASA
jgi:small subunit ribosomal protein S18